MGFWRDTNIRGALSDDAKLLLAYLISNEHSTASGCYRLPLAYISDDLRWGIERVSDTLSELHRKPFVCRDDTTEIIYMPGWWDENEIVSPKNAIHVANLFKSLPDCWIRTAAIENLKGYRNHSEGVRQALSKVLPKCAAGPSPPEPHRIPHPIPVRTHEQEQEPVRRLEETPKVVVISEPAVAEKPPAVVSAPAPIPPEPVSATTTLAAFSLAETLAAPPVRAADVPSAPVAPPPRQSADPAPLTPHQSEGTDVDDYEPDVGPMPDFLKRRKTAGATA